jgi:hypothetical protein
MRRRTSSSALAGWLLADSMLALMLVALASAAPATPRQDDGPSAAVTAEDQERQHRELATALEQERDSAAQLRTELRDALASRERGVEQSPVIRILEPAGSADAIDELITHLFAEEIEGARQAAFVLTFGSSSSPSEGVGLARRANEALRRSAPGLFAGAAQRDFWQASDDGLPRGHVRIEVYLLAE